MFPHLPLWPRYFPVANFNANGYLKPIPHTLRCLRWRREAGVLVSYMSINRTHGVWRPWRQHLLLPWRVRSCGYNSWLGQDVHCVWRWSQTHKSPLTPSPGPSTSYWTSYMHMVTTSLILTCCEGNSGARDGRGPAGNRTMIDTKGSVLASKLWWWVITIEFCCEYIEHMSFLARGAILEFSFECQLIQSMWLIVCIQWTVETRIGRSRSFGCLVWQQNHMWS